MPWTLKVAIEGLDDSSVPSGTDKRREYRDALEKIVKAGFDMCQRHLNEFDANSEVSQINASRDVGKPIALSEHLFNIFQLSVRTSRATGGAFDLGYVVLLEYLSEIALRNGGRLEGVITEKEQQGADKLATDFAFENAFDFNEKNRTLAKKKPHAKIGIVALSKGYTVDVVVEALNKSGYSNVLFEWAGDMRASGTNEQSKPWSVGIVCPPSMEEVDSDKKPHMHHATRKYLRTCQIQDAAICTSGDYEYRLAGRLTRLVLMKKATLVDIAEDQLAQVSVVSTSCAVADALATTLLLKRTISNARWWLTQWRSVRFPILDYTFYVRQGEVVARKHEVSVEAPEVRAARIRDNLPARVIVVGGGLAGLSAAIEAASCNASVIVMEKTTSLGGNSAKATSGINGWGTRMQGALDIEDDGRFFERDTFLSGRGGVCDVNLVKTLSLRSRDALHWLQSQTQLELSVVSQLGGHSRRRTHRIPDSPNGDPVPVGYTIMARLRERIERDFADKITIMKNTTVASLISEAAVGDDHIRRVRVTGVKYRLTNEPDATPEQLLADAVVLATGGFSNDHTETSLLAEYAPQLEAVPTTNGPFATGDGVKMAREIGATLIDMDKIQLHPTGFIDPANPTNPTKYLGPEALRGSGGILVAPNGRRFVNELDLRSKVSNAIKALGNDFPGSKGLPFAYCVLNKHASKLFGPAQLSFYRDKVKLFKTAHNHQELAQLIGCDVAAIKQTLAEYAAATTSSRCTHTGKSVFPCAWAGAAAAKDAAGEGEVDDFPYEVAVVTPCIHYTMGGVAISPAAEVQIIDHSKDAQIGRSRPVRGLFAAGEVSAGVHGANRLGGNSLLECVVFGRIAGDRAASILQRHTHGALTAHSWTWTTVREIREGTEYGRGARIIRFNFPGSMQPSGLSVGQFVSIRGEWDGKQLLGHYSPVTLPNDVGVIGLLVRVDKGPLREWLAALQPGHAVEMKAGGGLTIDRYLPEKCFLFEGMKIRKLGLIAGGTGVAPMLQIIRAALKAPFREGIDGLRLVYASETVEELTYENVLKRFEQESDGKFSYTIVLNNPPAGWTGGVGFVDVPVLRETLFGPSSDHLIVICGPPIMQRIVKRVCSTMLKHEPKMVRTVDEQPTKPISKQ